LNAIDTIPLVDTYTVKDITYCSAVPSGIVLSGGGQEVIERGICYGAEPVPTIEGMHVALGSGVGPFECQITDLLPDTRYYICAYAICTKGVYYGDQLAFDTKPLPLEVLTGGLSDVTGSRVKAEGRVTRDGGYEVTECGFCWGTEHEPTIEGLHIKASVGLGKYSCYFSGLQQGQTHYVRAYAVNEEGVAYGEEVEFVPNDPFLPWPDGTLPGLFSVSENRKVRFSQGNLQFNPDDNVWRFAEDQWDFVGGTCLDDSLGEMNVGTVYANKAKCDNTKVFKYYPGWIDLYGWATSGWDNGNLYYKPYDYACHISIWGLTSDCGYYGPLGNYDLSGEYAQADWGVHNPIINGGSRQWRTPRADEFNYILLQRETPSGIRFAKAVVGGVRGMVVLPDDWNASVYPLNEVNIDCDYYVNKITCGEWLDMLEPAGAVFLPAAGRRYQEVGETQILLGYQETSTYYCDGNYWTSSSCDGKVDCAKVIWFSGTDGAYYYPYFEYEVWRCYGFSVRLVSDEGMSY
jgi:hypothetical protein